MWPFKASPKSLKPWRAFWTLGVMLIPTLAAGVYFRLYPLTVFPEIATRNQAQFLVYANIQRKMFEESRKAHPKLTPDAQDRLARQSFKQYLSDQKTKIDNAIENENRILLKKRSLSDSKVYLMEVDPYYYYGLTAQLLRDKKLPEAQKGRNYLNLRTLAPAGAWYPLDFHAYTGFISFKILSFFSPKTSLMEAVGWVPIFLSLICLIPFLLIAFRQFKVSALAAFIAGVWLLICPAFLRRSLWGWYDTDAYNVFFPLLTSYFLLDAMRRLGEKKARILLCYAALAVCVYSLFWRGWLLEFSLIALSFMIATFLGCEGSLSKRFLSLKMPVLLFIGLPLLFTAIFWGPTGFTEIFSEAKDLLLSFYTPNFSLWPDVFLTVGELRHSSFSFISKSLGGFTVLFLAFLGLLSRIKNVNAHRLFSAHSIMFLIVLTGISALAALRVERLVLLLVAPVSLGFLLGVHRLITWLNRSKFISPTCLKASLASALLILILWQADQSIKKDQPIYNKTWDKSMSYLRNQTPQESIVTSWWSPGHFITSMAERRVSFDGSTQNTPQAFWVANFFLQSSEINALGILRMLNTSGNMAQEWLAKKELPLPDAVDLIKTILPQSKENALNLLRTTFKIEGADELIRLTHGDMLPPAYIFIYNDMVTQAMALEYTGKWDFRKAQYFRERLKEKPETISKDLLDRKSKAHTMLLWSMAEGPYAQEAESYQSKQIGSFVTFTNGLILDLVPMQAKIESEKYGSGTLESVYYMHQGSLEKKIAPPGSLKLSVLVLKDEKTNILGQKKASYRCVLADARLIESMLFRMYYLKGEGLKHFRLVDSQEDLETRTKCYVFEALWVSDFSST